ncbi:hypothetical protein B0T21DRAFT_359620 [Apiosordaria backusii]|uniref:Uncharacterized protein n=1 Tax=Apiosordaria backusii TaxID=314023 RepID=A0AA40ETY9_9PEZI|nr:hypothetical protein B0T21DRAFT_359620 [Apiosordaria backusii]
MRIPSLMTRHRSLHSRRQRTVFAIRQDGAEPAPHDRKSYPITLYPIPFIRDASFFLSLSRLGFDYICLLHRCSMSSLLITLRVLMARLSLPAFTKTPSLECFPVIQPLVSTSSLAK